MIVRRSPSPIVRSHALAAMAVTAILFTPLLVAVILPTRVAAQHTRHEIAVELAIGGQLPLVRNSAQNGFFTNPTLFRLEYQAATNSVQSLSVFLESVSETRGRDQLWSNFPSNAFDAHLDETLHMTSLGLITQRTLVSTGKFRIAAGLGLGFGLGRPSIDVRNKATGATTHSDAADEWDGLLVQGQLRARLTVYQTEQLDIGLMLLGRYWGFATIGPMGVVTDVYNGPSFTSVHELGYLAGISVGF